MALAIHGKEMQQQTCSRQISRHQTSAVADYLACHRVAVQLLAIPMMTTVHGVVNGLDETIGFGVGTS